MTHKITYEQCKSNICGICSRCGGHLEPIETVDNSGDPTFWQGCKSCHVFNGGVSQETYFIAKELVEKRHFRPYSHINHDPKDSKNIKQYKLQDQISGACDIVSEMLQIQKQQGLPHLKKRERRIKS